MAFSSKTYIGDGILTDFLLGISIGFLEDFSVITVTIDGVEQIEGIGNDWYFSVKYTQNNGSLITSASTIKFNVAPLNTSEIIFKRVTDRTKISAIFENGSLINPSDLDIVHYQLLFLNQESFDKNTDFINSFAGNNIMNQDLDMGSNFIINLKDGVLDTDAITYKQAQDLIAASEEPIIQQTVDGEGYQIGQTALSGTDLTAIVGFEFIAVDTTKQITQASYTEFDTATGGAYDIGGGILEIQAMTSPDVNQKYYMRLK